MQWWYGIKGQQQGPVEEEELRRMAREGLLSPDDLVWNPSLGQQWVRAASVGGLFPNAGTPPPLGVVAGAGTGGQTHNRDLMTQARERLQGKWGVGVVATLIFCGVSAGVSVFQLIPFVGWIVSFLISGPLTLGLAMFFLKMSRSVAPDYGNLFDGFKQFGSAFLAYFLMNLFIVLWTLLLIVPGIMAALSYGMTYYILADNPGLSPLDAIGQSKKLMYGHRWKLFCLGWRFFGWSLLCVLTCGIGFLWLMPYMQTSFARFYDDIQAPA